MKYIVRTQGTYTQRVIVEAADKDEAIQKALEGDCYDYGPLDISPLFRDLDEADVSELD